MSDTQFPAPAQGDRSLLFPLPERDICAVDDTAQAADESAQVLIDTGPPALDASKFGPVDHA